jgi:hypothetical protein
MSTVDELFDRFRAAFQAGERADPADFLTQLSGTDRRELEALIHGFLERGGRRRFDAAAFAADPLAQRVEATLRERMTESWQTLLPTARDEAQLLRSDVVTRLAAALGVSGRRDKVETYYHQMEQGRLEPSRVSERVLAALSAIVGVSAERLRAAGRLAPPPAPGAQVFARSAPSAASMPAPAKAAAAPEEWDEVDELFRGG